MNPQQPKNIYQVLADDIKEDGLLEYIKKNHEVLYGKYIMIDFSKIAIHPTNEIELTYLQMLQYCASLGNNYLMIIL